ncbi:MAG: hypothetical protein NWQ19_02805 [Nonlabens sp.]|nr:hypothetical protein [Nonlabens sp.]
MGEWHTLAMIKMMLQQRAARSKKRFHDIARTEHFYNDAEVRHEYSPEQVAHTKEHFAQQRKKEVRSGYIKIIVVLVLTILIVAAIVYAMQHLFFNDNPMLQGQSLKNT